MLRESLAAVFVIALCLMGQEKEPEPARVEGRVLDAISGQPVRKAAVIVRQEKVQDSGFATLTDAAGHFEFTGLAAGTWIAEVQRDGYVELSSLRGGAVLKELRWQLAPGGVLKDLTLRLTPTGVITGRVVDKDGEPLAGVGVALAAQGTKQAPRVSAYVTTNDLGEYRLYNVVPGRYLVSARYEQRWRSLGIRLTSRANKSGQQPPAEDYVTTHYPGVADLGQAVAVPVGPGAHVEGIDIRLARARVVRVRGRVVAPDNARGPFTFVGLMEASSGSPVAGRSYQTMAKSDGTFDLDGVQPGRYLLQCNFAGDSEQLRCRQWIDVGDVDVEGIQARPTPARKIEGKLSTDAQTPLPENLQALLVPREGDPIHMGGGIAPIKPDGSFVFDQAYDGKYDLILAKLGGEPDQFYAKAVRFGDKDALEEGMDVGGAKTGKLEVVLGDDGGTFECKVVSARGEPVEGAFVLLVPDAPRQHALILFGQAETDEKGECKVPGMAPGAYHAFAFDSKQQIDFMHPENLKPFESSGKPVEFAAKQSVRLELTAIR